MCQALGLHVRYELIKPQYLSGKYCYSYFIDEENEAGEYGSHLQAGKVAAGPVLEQGILLTPSQLVQPDSLCVKELGGFFW